MSLLNKFRDLNLNKSKDSPSKQEKISITEIITKELKEKGVLTNFEIINALQEALDRKSRIQGEVGEKYLSTNNYLRSKINTIPLSKAALNFYNKKRFRRNVDIAHVKSQKSCLLYYNNEKTLYSYLSKRLNKKTLSVEYEF